MRLFIAVTLNEEVKDSALRIQDQFRTWEVSGTYTPEENLHMTLAFIGEYPDPDHVLEVLEKISFEPFSLTFDRVGCFDDLWWLGSAENEELSALVKKVRHVLADAGIPYDRKRFKPHITLLRRASLHDKHPAINTGTVTMEVDTVTLIRSVPGKHGMIYTGLGTVLSSPAVYKEPDNHL